MGRGLGGGGIEQKGKRTHGYGQQCGDCWGEGLKGNGKIQQKLKLKNIFISILGSFEGRL